MTPTSQSSSHININAATPTKNSAVTPTKNSAVTPTKNSAVTPTKNNHNSSSCISANSPTSKNNKPVKKAYVVFVGNLPFEVTKEQLEEHFRKTGKLYRVSQYTWDPCDC